MAIADFLKDIGTGVEKGAKAVGAVLEPVAKRTAEVVSGEAPQIDEEKRQQAQQQNNQVTEAKAQQLESQLEMGRKYGTLNPDQQKQYVDAITQLYSHPSQMGTLVSKLHKMTHPDGATYQAAPLTNATPKGGTQGADAQAKLGYAGQLSGQEDELKKQQAVQSIDWFKKNMLPQFPSDQQATKLNEYIDHINGITQGTAKPPKEDKLDASGIFDGETGKFFTGEMLDSGNAPPDKIARWKSQKDAEKKKAVEKQREWQQTQDSENKRQQVNLKNQSDREISMFHNMMSMDQFKLAQGQVNDHQKLYEGAVDLQKKMQKLLPAALAGNQQAQVAILADHIAMTTHQPGASMRPTQALFNEAAGSQPTLEKYRKYFDENVTGGFKSGLVLSKEEAQQMSDMAQTSVDAERETVQEMQQAYKEQLNPTAESPKTGAKKVAGSIPKVGAQPSGGQSIVQRSKKTGAYRYSLDGGKTWQPGQPPGK